MPSQHSSLAAQPDRTPVGITRALIIAEDALARVAPAALEVLRRHWRGPLAAYPECGHFAAPDWQFVDVAPDEYARRSGEWRRLGATALGGCCGVGPAHIARLRREHPKDAR